MIGRKENQIEQSRIEASFVNAKISIEHVNKIYQAQKREVTALSDINIQVLENEFVCIVGPSGCGKSTLLNMIAGLEDITSGTIKLNQNEVNGPSAERGMVFQNYTLFPWMTISENINFGLRLQKKSKQEIKQITDKYLELIGLENFRNSYPKELSGGMKQRVAIARALANSPEVLLMDEPFGALDPHTKSSMQMMMRHIWQEEKTTIVFITHDIEEAVFLAETVYVLKTNPGEVKMRVPIYLPAERTLDMKDTKRFIDIKKKLNTLMYE